MAPRKTARLNSLVAQLERALREIEARPNPMGDMSLTRVHQIARAALAALEADRGA